MFLGRFDHTIDPKGRISIPAKFRDLLLGDPRLVLAPDYIRGQPCVVVHPQAQFAKLLERLDASDPFDEPAQNFEVGHLWDSQEVEIDGAGRILVPPGLRQHAGLVKDVVVLGAHVKFRLMDRETCVRVKGEHKAEAAVSRAPYKGLGK